MWNLLIQFVDFIKEELVLERAATVLKSLVKALIGAK
jgi:hypothetical protein